MESKNNSTTRAAERREAQRNLEARERKYAELLELLAEMEKENRLMKHLRAYRRYLKPNYGRGPTREDLVQLTYEVNSLREQYNNDPALAPITTDDQLAAYFQKGAQDGSPKHQDGSPKLLLLAFPVYSKALSQLTAIHAIRDAILQGRLSDAKSEFDAFQPDPAYAHTVARMRTKFELDSETILAINPHIDTPEPARGLFVENLEYAIGEACVNARKRSGLFLRNARFLPLLLPDPDVNTVAAIISTTGDRGARTFSPEQIDTILRRLRVNFEDERRYIIHPRMSRGTLPKTAMREGDASGDAGIKDSAPRGLQPYLDIARRVRYGGATLDEQQLHASLLYEGLKVDDVFPVIQFNDVKIIGILDSIESRFPGLRLKDHGIVEPPSDETGEYIMYLRMHIIGESGEKWGPHSFEATAVENTFLRQLYRIQLLKRGRRSPPMGEAQLVPSDVFIDRVRSDVLTIVEELAAKTFDQGWGHVTSDLSNFSFSLKAVRQEYERNNTWSSQQEDAWQAVKDFIEYLEQNVATLHFEQMPPDHWSFFRYCLTGVASIEEARQSLDFAFAWLRADKKPDGRE